MRFENKSKTLIVNLVPSMYPNLFMATVIGQVQPPVKSIETLTFTKARDYTFKQTA